MSPNYNNQEFQKSKKSNRMSKLQIDFRLNMYKH